VFIDDGEIKIVTVTRYDLTWPEETKSGAIRYASPSPVEQDAHV
jgi:hypothetical protein